MCEYRGEVPQEGGRIGLSFDIAEFADLADGRRITVHEGDFGYTTVLSSDDDPWSFQDEASIIASTLVVVQSEDDDPDDRGEDHPWTWLVGLLSACGIDAPVEQVRSVPYVVELGPELRARLV